MANNSPIQSARKLAKSQTFLWGAVALLVIYWLVRTWALTAFPSFIDEAAHINFGRDVLNSSLFARAQEGRQFVVWLFILFGAQASAPLWIERTATLLMTLVGFAAVMGAARLLANGWGAIFAGLLLILSPYHHFFERLALADPISASGVMVALYFAARLNRRIDFRDATLCGVALFFACGAKISALPYLTIPVLAMLALHRSRAGIRWAIEAMGVAIGLNVLLWGLMIWRDHNPLFLLMRASHNTSLIQVFLPNAVHTIQMLANYFGVLATGGMIVAIVVLVLLKRLFLPLCLIVPLCAFWFSSQQDSRYFIAPMTLLILGASLVLGELVEMHRGWRLPTLAVIVVWGLALWLPGAVTIVRDPVNLSLPIDDHNEYMTSEGSGFGLDSVIATLNTRHPTRVIGVLANCFSLRDLAPFPVECPRLNPNGEDKTTLENLLSASRAAGTYGVLESIPYAPASAPGTVVATIDAQRPRLTIYDLAP